MGLKRSVIMYTRSLNGIYHLFMIEVFDETIILNLIDIHLILHASSILYDGGAVIQTKEQTIQECLTLIFRERTARLQCYVSEAGIGGCWVWLLY